MTDTITIEDIESLLIRVKNNPLKEERKQMLIDGIDELCDQNFEAGAEYAEQGDLDIETRRVEKICTEYAVLQFADCHTLADFQDKLKEITLRSYNFM